jgi:hypothetical protein
MIAATRIPELERTQAAHEGAAAAVISKPSKRTYGRRRIGALARQATTTETA